MTNKVLYEINNVIRKSIFFYFDADETLLKNKTVYYSNINAKTISII